MKPMGLATLVIREGADKAHLSPVGQAGPWMVGCRRRGDQDRRDLLSAYVVGEVQREVQDLVWLAVVAKFARRTLVDAVAHLFTVEDHRSRVGLEDSQHDLRHV